MSTQPPSEGQKSAWAKFITGFGYASGGLWYALSTQINMKVHLALTALAIALGILLHISPVEFALIFVAIASVLIAELFNTVIELCVDLISPGFHPLAKHAKDVAAGAVLLSAMLAIVIALFVYVPHLLAIFSPKK
jgi:diacylglycerol kinase